MSFTNKGVTLDCLTDLYHPRNYRKHNGCCCANVAAGLVMPRDFADTFPVLTCFCLWAVLLVVDFVPGELFFLHY